jgi:hypothetical protein
VSQNEIHYLDEEERARASEKVSNHSHLTIEINEKWRNGGMEE